MQFGIVITENSSLAGTKDAWCIGVDDKPITAATPFELEEYKEKFELQHRNDGVVYEIRMLPIEMQGE